MREYREWLGMTEKMAKELKEQLRTAAKELEDAKADFERAKNIYDAKKVEFAKLEQQYRALEEARRAFAAVAPNGTAREGPGAKEKVLNNMQEISSPVEGEKGFGNEAGREEGEELSGDRLREEVIKVLFDAYPEPLHYKDILQRLVASGFKVAGKDPGANILAHINRDSRVMKTKIRGVYTLAPEFMQRMDGPR